MYAVGAVLAIVLSLALVALNPLNQNRPAPVPNVGANSPLVALPTEGTPPESVSGGDGSQSSASPVIEAPDLQLVEDSNQFMANLAFNAREFEGKTGCAVLAFADANTHEALKRPGGRDVQFLEEFTPGPSARMHLQFSRPLADLNLSPGTYSVVMRAYFFANPCSVPDDPVIFRSQQVPFSVTIGS